MEISAAQSTRIRLAILLLFTLFLLRGFAQERISSRQIMADMREGKSIQYENTIIQGTLDFTYMQEKLVDLPKAGKWWKKGKDNTVEESIGVKVEFRNCIFTDEVLAYIHEEESGYTFIADFDKKVSFENCTFEDNAMFKYSDFDSPVSFAGSKFMGKSTFKYAEFDDSADFGAVFFDDDATFKYAKFEDGVSFKNAQFDESWNIKYMKARGAFDISGLKVEDDIDAKYTKINGESFTKYLVNARK